jgi:hypothetical protein
MPDRVFPFVISTLLGAIFGSTGAWILWGKVGLGWSFLCIAAAVVVIAFAFGFSIIEGDEDCTGDIRNFLPWPRPSTLNYGHEGRAMVPPPSTPPDPFEDEE